MSPHAAALGKLTLVFFSAIMDHHELAAKDLFVVPGVLRGVASCINDVEWRGGVWRWAGHVASCRSAAWRGTALWHLSLRGVTWRSITWRVVEGYVKGCGFFSACRSFVLRIVRWNGVAWRVGFSSLAWARLAWYSITWGCLACRGVSWCGVAWCGVGEWTAGRGFRFSEVEWRGVAWLACRVSVPTSCTSWRGGQ